MDVRDRGWMIDAACRGRKNWDDLTFNTQAFYCGSCPVRAECAEYAVLTHGADEARQAATYSGLRKVELRRLISARSKAR